MTSRNRTRSDPGKPCTLTRRVNGVVTHYSEQAWQTSEETMDDHVIPDFHRRSARGDIINNPCAYVKETTDTTGPGVYSVTIGGSVYDVYGDEGSVTTALHDFLVQLGQSNKTVGYLAPATPDTKWADEAKAKALANVDRTPYAFGEDIGEIGQTLRFLKNPLGTLRKAVQAFSKDRRRYLGDLRDTPTMTRNQAKALFDLWLEYRFAFSPLVRSVNDAIAAFATKTNRPERRTARGFTNDSFGDSDTPVRSYWTWERSVNTDVDYHAAILYEVSNPIADWRFKYGLRFKDLPETLWQLVPLSFMADRVVNISNSIGGIINLIDPNVEILAASLTTRQTQVQSKSCIDYTYPSESLTFVPDTDILTKYSYTRTPWTPSLTNAVPILRPQYLIDDSSKLVDLMALLYTKVVYPALIAQGRK